MNRQTHTLAAEAVYIRGIRANLHQFIQQAIQVFFIGLVIGMERNVLPVLSQDFGVPKGSFLFLMSFVISFGFVKGILNFVAGRLSERIGRKKVLLLGWIAAIPIPFMILYAPSWGWIVAANVFLGINQGFAWSMTVTSKVDITRADQRGFATGVNEFAGYAAVGIGGLVTGYLAVIYGPREALFGFGLAVIVIGMLIAFFFIKETLPWAKVESREHASGNYVGHKPRFPEGVSEHPGTWEIFTLVSFRHPTLNALCQAGVANKIADALLWVLFPVFLHDQGLNIVQIGWVTAVYGMVWGASQLLTGALSDIIGRKKPIIGGLWLLGIGIAAVPLVHGMTAWTICAAIMGIGMALLYPNLIAALADISHPNWRSSALGTYRYWRDTGYAIGAIALGLVAQGTHSVEIPFWFTAVILGVSGVYLALRAEETHPRINPATVSPAPIVAPPTLEVRVISQTPPGGRCGLYTGYGQALVQHLGSRFQLDISTERDAHGHGFPSIWINGSPLRPSDGVIVMPEDVVEVLAANKITVSNDLGLALIAEVNKMLHEGD